MKTRCVSAVLAVLMVVGVSGCRQDKIMAPGAGRADPIMLENYPRIVALEKLSEYLVFSAPNVRSSPQQPMSVSVPVRLQSDKEVNIQYRFEFFAPDGRPMQQADQWRFMHLSSRDQHFLQGSALDTQAADWRLVVRPAR